MNLSSTLFLKLFADVLVFFVKHPEVDCRSEGRAVPGALVHSPLSGSASGPSRLPEQQNQPELHSACERVPALRPRIPRLSSLSAVHTRTS